MRIVSMTYYIKYQGGSGFGNLLSPDIFSIILPVAAAELLRAVARQSTREKVHLVRLRNLTPIC